MKDADMITLIGVGHVFAISENVKELIRSRRPGIVCLELDPARFNALVQKDTSKSVPIQYKLLAYFQKRMASKFGSEVGDEMMAAVSAAQEIGAKVALIDMDAAAVFARLWRRMSFREKLHLFGGAFVGLFMSKETVEREMERYEKHDEQYIEKIGDGFPAIKEVLIDDRNKFMAQKISSLSMQHGSIVAVVGDGHVPGLIEGLKPLEVEVIRLKDVRAPPKPPEPAAEFTTSFYYNNQ